VVDEGVIVVVEAVAAVGSQACGRVNTSLAVADVLVLVVLVVGRVVVAGKVCALAAPEARAKRLTAHTAERSERDMYR
jgi:hypothetical protein